MPFPSDRNWPTGRGLPATAEQIVVAQQQGRDAVHAGVTPGRGQYVSDHSPRGRFLAVMWFRGYTAEQQRISNHRAAQAELAEDAGAHDDAESD